MRSYIMICKDNSGFKKLEFLDKDDQKDLDRLTQKLENGQMMIMEIKFHKPKVSKNQVNLIRVLSDIISKSTGQDKKEVYETLIERYFGENIDLENCPKDEFDSFLNSSLSFVSDFFGINIQYNNKTSRLEEL